MEDNGVLLKKFAVMDDEIAHLRGLGSVSAEQLDGDHFLKRGVERALQVCIEVVVDVAQRVLSLHERPPSPTAFGAIESLEAMGIIACAEKYRRMIQFRNFVVHRYARVESAVLADVLVNHLGDLTDFRDEIAGRQ